MTRRNQIFALWKIISIIGFIMFLFFISVNRSSSDATLYLILCIIGFLMFVGGIVMLIITAYRKDKQDKQNEDKK